MKKLILLVILCNQYYAKDVNAQCSPWCLSGNTIIGTHYLGGDINSGIPLRLKTIAPYSIEFYTKAIQRMMIDTLGKVGIGTNGPQSLLNVDATNSGIGEIFRTDGITDYDNKWQFFVDGYEKFYLIDYAFSDNIWMAAGYGSLNQSTLLSAPINWYTGTVPRMQIYDGSGNPNLDGNVAIGDFDLYAGPQDTIPQSLLHMHKAGKKYVYHQFTNTTTGVTASDGFKVGIDTIGRAELRQYENSSMKFYTFNSLRAIIDNAGLVGINTAVPLIQLDVKDGININTPGIHHYYMIDTNRVLSNPGGRNIFVGVQAGSDSTQQHDNVAVGWNAGNSLYKGTDNTMVGVEAGRFTVGTGSVGGIVNGTHNSFFGDWAGKFNTSGRGNTHIGAHSGQSDSGSTGGVNNTCVGSAASCTNTDTNATAIGSGAKVIANNTMILGDNDVNVGIGLSGVSGGPRRKLEIRSMNEQFRLTNKYDTTYTDMKTTSSGDLYIHPDSGTTDRRVGINDSTPGNTLEINSTATSKIPGASGLRFSDLDSTSTAGKPNGKVVSVNGQGDLILVRDSIGTGTGLGDVVACSDTIRNNYVTKWTDSTAKKICNSQIFDTGTRVGIGTSNPDARLEIYDTPNRKVKIGDDGLLSWAPPGMLLSSIQIADTNGDWSNAIFSNRVSRNSNLGIRARNDMVFYQNVTEIMRINGDISHEDFPIIQIARGGGIDNHAIFNVQAGIMGYGTDFLTTGAAVDIHNYDTSAFSDAGYAIGARIVADGSAANNTNFALYVKADNGNHEITDSSIANFAIWSAHGSDWNNEGSGPWDGPSDIRLKRNIVSFTDGLEVLRQINPKRFNFNGKAGTNPDKEQIGVIAQEILSVAPYTIRHYKARFNPSDSMLTSLYGFNSGSLIYVAINAVKQLDSIVAAQNIRIDSQNIRLDSLSNALVQCCTSHTRSTPQNGIDSGDNRIVVELSSGTSIILLQNDPNPFSEKTEITFQIPDEVSDARIIFYTNSGRILKTVVINERGQGTMLVYASTLSSGIYSYSLIADGKLIDTKKMVCTK